MATSDEKFENDYKAAETRLVSKFVFLSKVQVYGTIKYVVYLL